MIDIENLIHGKYYKFVDLYFKTVYYYKFDYKYENHIYFYGFKFEDKMLEKPTTLIFHDFWLFPSLSIKLNRYYIEEIDPISLLNYFSINHPEKKFLLRRNKINSLLDIK